MGKKSKKIVSMAVAALFLSTTTHGAIFNDDAAGAWNLPATWGTVSDVPTSTSDVITIDQHTVSATAATFTGGELHVEGTGRLSYSSGTPAAPLNMFLNGGTFSAGHHTFAAGVSGTNQYLDIEGTSKIVTASAGNNMGIGSSSRQLQLTGSGTLIKTGTGLLTLDASATDATNLSDFNGTIEAREGNLVSKHPFFLRNASVILGFGGVGAVLDQQFGGTTEMSIPTVKNVYGHGTMLWNSGSGFGRDLRIAPGGVLSPGTSIAPGTITRSTLGARNDLDFRTDGVSGNSSLEMDVFGPTQADADQIVWTDTVSVSVADIAGADLVVRLYTPTESLTLTQWVLLDGDEFGNAGTAGTGTSTAANQSFASIAFKQLDGSPIDLYDGSPTDSGWQNLLISYGGTSGNSDRQVILSGSYVAAEVPEPGALGVLAMGAVGFVARRRKRQMQ